MQKIKEKIENLPINAFKITKIQTDNDLSIQGTKKFNNSGTHIAYFTERKLYYQPCSNNCIVGNL